MAHNRVSPLLESTAAQLANATLNGTTRSGADSSKFRAFSLSNVVGTLNVQQSWDGGTTWVTTHTAAAGAGTPTVIEAQVLAPMVRVQYVNGAGAQGSFTLASTLLAI